MKDQENEAEAEIEQYLRDLSDRLRGWRARRGMRRKDLANHSGVSERYLAQLEGGDANPSLGLLLRLVNAMDISLQDLLISGGPGVQIHAGLFGLAQRLSAEQQAAAYSMLLRHFSPDQSAFAGCALIGLRGAGKTTLGERLSAAFGVPFVRLGNVIENLGGMELAELFSLGGQKAYRRLERQALDLVTREHPGCIVEAGGSLVSEVETFNALRSSFYTIWVRAEPEDHMNRVIQQGDLRPINSSEEAMADLRRILAEREPYYRTADYVIDTSARSIDDCLAELEPICRPYLSGEPMRADTTS
ncbi:MAG: helix-turn-helix transcriptional regulator [Aquisalimonadaceae bacterium]